METKEENGDESHVDKINKTTMKKKKKKLSRVMHVLSVVLFMLRRRRRRKPFNTWFWRRVVESVRKARSEITIMPSSNFINTICLPPPPAPETDVIGDGGDDDHPGEYFAAEVITSSSPSGIYGYGSAMSLRDLGYHDDDDDEDDDDEDDDECYSDVEGDDMIDEKAEEFIQRFYEQMKMQNQVYTERCKPKLG